MSSRNWRSAWTTPGESESTHAFLDFTVNTAQGITQPNGNTDDSKIKQVFAFAKPGATQILVGPSSYASPTVLANLTFPLQFIVCGSYEATLS
jgi:hypothetical protein